MRERRQWWWERRRIEMNFGSAFDACNGDWYSAKLDKIIFSQLSEIDIKMCMWRALMYVSNQSKVRNASSP